MAYCPTNHLSLESLSWFWEDWWQNNAQHNIKNINNKTWCNVFSMPWKMQGGALVLPLHHMAKMLKTDFKCDSSFFCCFIQIQVSYYPPGQYPSSGQQYRVPQPMSHQVSYPAQRTQPMPQPTQQSGQYIFFLCCTVINSTSILYTWRDGYIISCFLCILFYINSLSAHRLMFFVEMSAFSVITLNQNRAMKIE